MNDQPSDKPRPQRDPAEGNPDTDPTVTPDSRSPGRSDAPASTGGDGSQGAGGPEGFGTGD